MPIVAAPQAGYLPTSTPWLVECVECRVLFEAPQVVQLSRLDPPLITLFERGVGAVERPHFDRLIHVDGLIQSADDAVFALAR